MMMFEKELEEIIKDLPYIIELRRHFHTFPEISGKEYLTARRIEEELDKLGIEHKRVGESGVCATIQGELGGNKCVLLRADIDALAIEEENECAYKSRNVGVMHACGHDVHTAALLGAARVLHRMKDRFGGTIRFAFQQGEEIGLGAKIFIKEDILEGVDHCFGLHVDSTVDVGSVVIMEGANNASVDWFKIIVHGKSGHICNPQLGVDAAYIASQIVVSLQALITKRTSPMDYALIGVGKINAGTAYNIIAQTAEIEGTVRVFSLDLRKQIKEEIEILVRSIANANQGEAEILWKDFTSPLINSEEECKEVREVAEGLFGKEHIISFRKPSLSGDDMAEFLLRVPGVYAYVGSRNKDKIETMAPTHNSHFDVDEDVLRVASSLYMASALHFLNKK